MTTPRDHDSVLDVDLAKIWTGVAAETWSTPVGRIERVTSQLLGSPPLARALVTTPSLVLAWILATVVVMSIGVVLTATSGEPWFALIAPALAGAGVAYAYGPGVDPAFELSWSMALPDRLVLLVRVLSVFGLNAIFGLAASLLSSVAIGLTIGWLLPMTTFSALGLAVATAARSANAGVAAAVGGWLLFVLAGMATTEELTAVLTVDELTPAYVGLTLACAWIAFFATSGRRWDRAWRWQ